jgi:uncharacterized OB-fold protein
MPAPDAVTQFFWDGAAQHKLMILQCQQCQKFIHPPRPVCRFCLSTDLAPKEMSGQATLYTWTIPEQAFHPFFADKLPYVYATVDLVEQPNLRMVTNIVDCPQEDLEAGMSLQVTFAEISPGLTLPYFRPA